MAGETETTNSTTDTSGELPESLDVAGAVAMMEGIADDDTGEAGTDAGGERGETAETTAEDQPGEEGDAETGQGEEEQHETTVPQFWSAEDKEAFAKLPPEAQAAVNKYETKRVAFEQEKAREAAQAREEAAAEVKKHRSMSEEAAAWWKDNGPALLQTFGNRWAAWTPEKWDQLAHENPAEWAAKRQEHDNELMLLRRADERARADLKAASDRSEAALVEAKRSEHTKVATDMPEHFGTPAKATKTYKVLGDYLVSQGITPQRINAIYEAPIIKLAMKAMLHDQAKAQASAVTGKTGQATQTGKQTPMRIAPGPAVRATGDRRSESARLVGERFRRSGGTSIADAAELIRLSEQS